MERKKVLKFVEYFYFIGGILSVLVMYLSQAVEFNFIILFVFFSYCMIMSELNYIKRVLEK